MSLQPDWWQNILLLLAKIARLPLAGAVIFCAVCCGFLLLMFIYRLSEWLFVNLLWHPW